MKIFLLFIIFSCLANEKGFETWSQKKQKRYPLANEQIQDQFLFQAEFPQEKVFDQYRGQKVKYTLNSQYRFTGRYTMQLPDFLPIHFHFAIWEYDGYQRSQGQYEYLLGIHPRVDFGRVKIFVAGGVTKSVTPSTEEVLEGREQSPRDHRFFVAQIGSSVSYHIWGIPFLTQAEVMQSLFTQSSRDSEIVPSTTRLTRFVGKQSLVIDEFIVFSFYLRATQMGGATHLVSWENGLALGVQI